VLGNLGEVATTGRDRERYGNALYGSFGRDFVTADGRRIMIVAITKRQWKGLVVSLELGPEIESLQQRLGVDFTADESARFLHRDALFALVEDALHRRHFGSLPELFDQHGVCWGEYQSVKQALDHDPRLSAANPMFERISHPSWET
jgi:2-methylfumaryl-CoA isomerase